MTEPREPSDPPRVLSYSSPAAEHTTNFTIARCGSEAEAAFLSAVLFSEGIRSWVMNPHTNALSYWRVDVELQVTGDDATRASKIVHRVRCEPESLEASEELDLDEHDTVAVDDLVEAAAYDLPQPMFDAAAVLGSAGIRPILPRLVARGDGPRGEGARFIVRVHASDAGRARELLEQDDDDEPRCPRCASWQVQIVSSLWDDLRTIFGGTVEPKWRCVRCGHEWIEPQRR